ncbi:helix-turn-helix domain-containing protein [Cellulosilyticum lentocellum]|uniref:Transcriptional regulator, AraC family n=1 Tax=Cellulosilyticum lentocellum (strain ATCC 49066 / DSM 5427 / NCIMB 11756 / RHM5) TaxID=642492 RepID=F2JRF1_CELLD|nr:AraC family transcriptional regulator [Cellulosilyticum lentocellum]ADZ82760.1 transcriptional regulator, AraC family [Cellulosilyticum lentocellum DSM 5427]
MGFLDSISPNHISSNFNIKSLNINTHLLGCCNRLSVVIIEKGIGSVLINEQVISIASPMIICLNETERLHFTSASNLMGKVISFHPNVIKDYFTLENIRTLDHSFSVEDIRYIMSLSIFFRRSKNYAGHLSTSEPVLKHLNKLLETILGVAEQPLLLSLRLSELLTYIEHLVKTYSILSESLITETSFEVKDVLLYLHNNYKQKITIPDLSRHFHVNRTTLSDRFYEATGETIITYLNKHRINLSAIFLRESTLSISDIADEVGFNDTAYFAKLFRKYMHHTPSGYRQRYYALSQLHKVDEKG